MTLNKSICQKCYKDYGLCFSNKDWEEGHISCPFEHEKFGTLFMEIWLNGSKAKPYHCRYLLEQIMSDE